MWAIYNFHLLPVKNQSHVKITSGGFEFDPLSQCIPASESSQFCSCSMVMLPRGV